ncbi:MICOS complex subunit mic25a [Nerophis lumbriciformis]|uniref:MICOS complex subunit mic25a n=1 Tax=Nerophis lumbriciformis TaxID=546530 RepID=UPI003BABD364
MGSGESTTRKVSFGVDDEERVRILRGVKLSEDVLQRMKGVANMPPPRAPPATSSQRDTGTSFSTKPQQNPQQRAQSSTPPKTSKTTTRVKEEQRKYERQKSILKETETGKEEIIKAMTRERQQTRQDAEKTKHLVQGLQKKELQLKALDAFYKEQVALLEKKNMEIYEQSKEQFHQAASKTESNVRSRSTDPVCLGLQAQIFTCYKENGQQTLRCSDLAKEYMRCINAAKRNNLVNRG